MTKQQLAAKIWESANKMRSKIGANQYKDYILGFIFYKYLSDKEIKVLKQDFNATDDDIKALDANDTTTIQTIQTSLGYFISYKDLFCTWIEQGNKLTIGDVLDAISHFNQNISNDFKNIFSEIFTVLQSGLTLLGSTAAEQSKAIRSLISLIDDIPMDGSQNYDVLGFIYEYLIGKFAENAGKKAGEFYTPHEISVLMSEIVAEHLKNRKHIKIYDPTSGSGSLLINIGKATAKHGVDKQNIEYYAQELKIETFNLTRMNLVMRGINPANIYVRNADTLESDWPLFDNPNDPSTYKLLNVDAVVSNPPYSLQWDNTNRSNDPRYNEYGLAPTSKADYAFLLHDLYHITSDGIMTIVLPHGVLFRGGEEGEIRKNLIEKNQIDTIIGLPANIFFGTGIPTIIMVLKKTKKDDNVLIIDASKYFTKEGKNNKLQASDIKRITDAVKQRTTIDKFCRLVSRQEIRENDFNLNIPRYVDSSSNDSSIDIYASVFGGIPQAELKPFKQIFELLPQLKQNLFTNPNADYLELKNNDIKDVFTKSSDVLQFIETFKKSLTPFSKNLKSELIQKAQNIETDKSDNFIYTEEEKIGNAIFSLLSKFPLIDEYKAYQILDDNWQKINADLETIQNEGYNSIKKVEPNMVVKNDDEVQNGWKGTIIPFELVQELYLKNELVILKKLENDSEEKQSRYDEIIEKIFEEKDEEQDESEADEELTASKYYAQISKLALKEKTHKFYADCIKAQALNNEYKTLNKQISLKEKEIDTLTKDKIENLNESEIKTLLETKLIDNLCDSLEKLCQFKFDEVISDLQKLNTKYKQTILDIEGQIAKESTELATLMADLTGTEADMKGIQELAKMLGV